jgi:hypothetical protein
MLSKPTLTKGGRGDHKIYLLLEFVFLISVANVQRIVAPKRPSYKRGNKTKGDGLRTSPYKVSEYNGRKRLRRKASPRGLPANWKLAGATVSPIASLGDTASIGDVGCISSAAAFIRRLFAFTVKLSKNAT